jgi:hypothetical protein
MDSVITEAKGSLQLITEAEGSIQLITEAKDFFFY